MPHFIEKKSASKQNIQKNPYDGPAPVGYNMGRGVLEPIIYQGTPLPLKNEVVTMPLPKDSMFIFQKNQAHPSCCPASFSTSTGCICTTEQQRRLLGTTDGNNANYPSDHGF